MPANLTHGEEAEGDFEKKMEGIILKAVEKAVKEILDHLTKNPNQIIIWILVVAVGVLLKLYWWSLVKKVTRRLCNCPKRRRNPTTGMEQGEADPQWNERPGRLHAQQRAIQHPQPAPIVDQTMQQQQPSPSPQPLIQQQPLPSQDSPPAMVTPPQNQKKLTVMEIHNEVNQRMQARRQVNRQIQPQQQVIVGTGATIHEGPKASDMLMETGITAAVNDPSKE